ncbi:2-C-methyl-D-erythritol 4-phosphate cytidylyltransferase [Aquirufa sp. HETE-83D]|uniref:2-C-methyl-D-erythritol 4-phosphate cytidylyltransferase n=1 Tax=Aquirufa esocilacus TaxID=3096513 RepID=A0ABW6DGU6_9BACT
MKKYAIIVAGGSGQRMQSTVSKQFLLLQGKPILYHTLAAFYQADVSTEIILVLPAEQFDYWESLMAGLPPIPHRLVAGGDSRFQSSQNAIQSLLEDGMVAIHDGVRPLIEPSLISASFRSAVEKGNAVLAVASKDSVRFYSPKKDAFEHLNREAIRLIQTPQIFSVKDLKEAFKQDYSDDFTDDARVVEAIGIRINLVEGSYKNIKITTPEDLLLAEVLMK